jgi:hypothetical protein
VTANRGPRVCLVVALAILVGLVAPSQMVLEWRGGETPQIAELFQQVPTRANLRRLESNLESRCRPAQAVRPWTQYLRFVLFEEAGDQAVLGRSGWFFYRPAVRYLVEPCALPSASTPVRTVPVRVSGKTPYGVTASEDDIFAAIVSFRDELARRGIRLLVMPAPNKASIYPEHLASRADRMPAPVNPTTRAVLAQLQEAGVEIVDLFEVYAHARGRSDGPACYLAQDSHWSPQGMRLAAEVVARRLLDSRWVQRGAAEYETKPVTVERYGDVLRMIRVPQVERLFRPERMNCTQVIDAQTGKPYTDDPNSPVLVLGDSFLRIFEQDEPGSGGFIAHLACHLGFGLTSLVNDGGASTLVRQQLARKPALLKGKKVVVWEFVERDIRFGTEGWQVVPLP